MTLLLRNSLAYGSARIARHSFLVLVAYWYGISRESDEFFFSYAIALFAGSALNSVFSQVLVSRIGKVSRQDLWLAFLFPVILYSPIVALTGNVLLLALSLYVGGSSASGLLAGRLANEGSFLSPPMSMLLAGIATLFFALFFRWVSFDIIGVAWSLGLAELTRFAYLLSKVNLSPGNWSETFSLLRSYWLLVAASVLFSSVALTMRLFVSAFLEVGSLSIFSYASAISGVLLTLFTGGILVTNGYLWREKISWDFRWPLIRIATLICGATSLLVVVIAGDSLLLKTVAVFVIGIPFYMIVFTAFSYLAATRGNLESFLNALAYLLLVVVASLFLIPVFGLMAAAWILTLGESVLALSLYLAARRQHARLDLRTG